MLSSLMVCGVWSLLMSLLSSGGSSSVWRVSVPEEHHLCMFCSDLENIIWTHQDRTVIATKQGNSETNQNRNKYGLPSDGLLCLKDLERSDAGRYSCNHRLVADVEVLTGQEFAVSAGRVLLIPCKNSGKPKQRWFYRRDGKRREPILTRFRNGTVKREREDPMSRFTFDVDALQILNLQPEDAGEYLCNGEVEARVIVRADQPARTSTQTPTATSSPAVTKPDVVDRKKKEGRPENALVVAAVTGLGIVVVLLAVICVLLINTKCCRKRKCRAGVSQLSREDTELQLWTPSSRPAEVEGLESRLQAEETVHYASLGRHNWKERPHRAPTDANQHVIYSSVITRPAGK